MRALVLSGAGNFGALQAGALETLLARGFRPDMVVGSSAGALNAIYVALDPTPAGARKLQRVWLDAVNLPIGIGNPISVIRRLLQRSDGLVSSGTLVSFLERHVPPEIETFGDLERVKGISVRAMAVRMADGALVAFGDQADDRLFDGAMASTAVSPYLAPWQVGTDRYLDGGVVSKLPLSAAIARGASEIVALDVVGALGSVDTAHGFLGVSGYSLSLLVEAQAKGEIARAMSSGTSLRVISLPAPAEVPFWDFTKAARLIASGRETAYRSLEHQPLQWPRPWIRSICRWLGRRWQSSVPRPSAAGEESG
ncbi:MAG: patatin-like phospholipase family protein [Anaerolineales bacterium]